MLDFKLWAWVLRLEPKWRTKAQWPVSLHTNAAMPASLRVTLQATREFEIVLKHTIDKARKELRGITEGVTERLVASPKASTRAHVEESATKAKRRKVDVGACSAMPKDSLATSSR